MPRDAALVRGLERVSRDCVGESVTPCDEAEVLVTLRHDRQHVDLHRDPGLRGPPPPGR